MPQETSRIVRIHEFGGPQVLRIEETVVPPPGPDQVRLSIRAIGLNRTELTLRSGRSPAKPALPTSLGFEAAGVIQEVGSSVSGWRIGDRVALVPAYSAAEYALYSELALVPARSLVAVPESQSFEQAAATWAAFGTAWAGLVATGNLQAGQTVLINAASSSVGLAAIQIARRIGALPIALTRTSSKVEALVAHGASEVITTSEGDVSERIMDVTEGKGAHLVLDAVAGPGTAKLLQATTTGGLLLLYGGLSPEPTVVAPFQIFARNLTIRGFALPAIAREDHQLAALKSFVLEGLAEGMFTSVIDRAFSFEQIQEAHRFLESGAQFGKVVITV
jgi:NADPH:quinone reductase-like Zn-dependent oxidoreductase